MFGIDEGPSGQEKNQYNLLNASSAFATGAGEGALTPALSFDESILSGDPTKIATAMAPEIKAQQDQNQQAKNQLAQFAPRSGGTAASTANIDATGRGNIIGEVGGLQTHAADSLAATGTNLLSQGMSGEEAGFNQSTQMQQQRASKWDDILKSISAIAGGAVGGIGNLDTTGGSSVMEQLQNFMSGAQA